ncbi:MAG: ABC transporter ATP-binding protein [Chloroflexota bacterium]|nr:ABC transporter ATP-binding protein [Chloroflexota bacterium]
MVVRAGSKKPSVALSGPDPAGYMVEAVDLLKLFGKMPAIDGLSMQIPQGETFGLLGPNGSGKTTFIRMVAGIVNPTSGILRVLGREMPRDAALVRPHIGYMTQLQALYNELSVWENVQFFGEIFGMNDKQARDNRVSEVLDLVELLSRKASPVGTLSGGLKQRVSLACALVHSPQLLLLDEPTVGVDPQLRQTFWGYFTGLNKQGVTIIISSHVMDEADRCDRLGLIRLGKLLAAGTPAEIRALGNSANLEEAFLTLSGAAFPQEATR